MLKGQSTKLLYGGEALLAHETSSSLNLTANTSDVASKSDVNPMYDHQEFNNYSFDASCEGILDSDEELAALIAYALEETGDSLELGNKSGSAFISSADFTFPSEGNSTVSMSFTGTGALS